MRLLFFTLFLIFSLSSYSQITQDTLASVISVTTSKNDTVSLIGVGDIMLGTNYPEDRLPPGDGDFLMREVEPVLQDADVTFGNLEGTLLDSGGIAKKCKDPKVCYAFRTPVKYVENLVKAGFDIMALANNHAGDMGDEGRYSTMSTLEKAGILHAGQITHKTTIFEKDSIRYGLAAFAPNSNCVSLNDIEGAMAIIAALDSLVDIVVVSFHGGAEGAQHQHVPRKNELYFGEDRGDVYKFSHTLIDAGADVIFGHGPHVTRAVEVYKDRFIAYSLGNFCTYKGISVNGINGLAPIIKVFTDRTGKFYYGQITPTIQTHGTGVKIDSEKLVIKIIQELTKKDFPETRIHIDDNGLITYLAQ